MLYEAGLRFLLRRAWSGVIRPPSPSIVAAEDKYLRSKAHFALSGVDIDRQFLLERARFCLG
jgi:hypothetical protein